MRPKADEGERRIANPAPVIPAPARLRLAAGEFRLAPGTTVAYRDPILAPLARRFAGDVARRRGIALDVGPDERAPAIVIDLGDDPDFAGLPAPLGLDPAGPPRDERYALTIDRSWIRLRGREPAGGDEPYGMPDQAYGVYVRRLKQAARALGKRTVGWQESIRAGADPGHVIQYWMDASSLGAGAEAPVSPEVAARVTANYRRARTDLELALAHGVPVIVSPQAHCYFDVPYAEAPADPAQQERRDQVGLRHYARRALEATFDWDPVAALGPAARPDHVAGVGAALWCETVRDVADLTFLLLPRLAGTAEKAWGAAGAVRWPEHRDALARHERLWAQDGLTFFSAART